MFASERYFRQIDKIHKHAYQKPEDQIIAEIREAFFSILGSQPDALKRELFNFYVEDYYDNRDQYGDFFDRAEGLSRIVDLFNREYDEGDSFSPDELDLLKALVNEHADTMDIDTLTFIMDLLLSKGHI